MLKRLLKRHSLRAFGKLISGLRGFSSRILRMLLENRGLSSKIEYGNLDSKPTIPNDLIKAIFQEKLARSKNADT